MRFYAVSGSAARQRTDCAIVGLYESGLLSAAAAQIDATLGGRIAQGFLWSRPRPLQL